MDTLPGCLGTRSVARHASDIPLCGHVQQCVENRRSGRSESGAQGLVDESESREACPRRPKACGLRWQDFTRNAASPGSRSKENAPYECIRGKNGNCAE